MAFVGRFCTDRIREAGPFPLAAAGWTQSASALRLTGHNQLADHVHWTQSRPDAIRDDTGHDGQHGVFPHEQSFEAEVMVCQQCQKIGRCYM